MNAAPITRLLVGLGAIMLPCIPVHAEVIWSKCTEKTSSTPIESFTLAVGRDSDIAERNLQRLTGPGCKIELRCKMGWYAQVGSPMVRGQPQNSAEGVSCGALTQEEALSEAYAACLEVPPNSHKRACRTLYHFGYDDGGFGDEIAPGTASMTGGPNDMQGCLDRNGNLGLATPRDKLPVCY